MARHDGRRSGGWLAWAACASMAAALVAGSTACRRPLAREKFAKVELGMSEAQVTDICGKPDVVRKMTNVFGPGQEDPYGDVPGAKPPENRMFVYTSGMEFAQVYFEDGHVFGVRFNNEFLKGDWMEGEATLPASPPPADR